MRWLFMFVLVLQACGSESSEGSPEDAGPSRDEGPIYLSCVGLPATCGASGTDDCCHDLAVPGGSFLRSYDLAGDQHSGTPAHPATVSSFHLDKYEVTVGRFRAFVAAGMGTQASPPASGAGQHARIAGSGWNPGWNAQLPATSEALRAALKCEANLQTFTDAPGPNDQRPVNCVSWYEAMAFCIWDGGRLPTEAEWNYAATGGDQQRAYPWSTPAGSLALDREHASYWLTDGPGCTANGDPDCALTDIVPVGTLPAGDGRWGHSDLAGNVYEWALDFMGEYPETCNDCANFVGSAHRELRGGSFAANPELIRAGRRIGIAPAERNELAGIRCAR